MRTTQWLSFRVLLNDLWIDKLPIRSSQRGRWISKFGIATAMFHRRLNSELLERLRMREIIFIYHYLVSTWHTTVIYNSEISGLEQVHQWKMNISLGKACAAEIQIVFSHRWSHYFPCRTPSVRTNYDINDRGCKSTVKVQILEELVNLLTVSNVRLENILPTYKLI